MTKLKKMTYNFIAVSDNYYANLKVNQACNIYR